MQRWNQRPTCFGQDPQVLDAGMVEYLEHMVQDLDVQVVRMQRMVHAEPENDQLPLILQNLLAARLAVFTEKRRRKNLRNQQ